MAANNEKHRKNIIPVVLEYRNLRALLGSRKHINKATANNHKPDLYILAETWWETDKHPVLSEYHLVTYELAQREHVTGRAKGGMAIYKHQDCQIPTRSLPLLKPKPNVMVLEIGATTDSNGLTAVIAYYRAPSHNPSAIIKFFDDIAEEFMFLEKKGYKTYTEMEIETKMESLDTKLATQALLLKP
jgi:hypothetical protein